MKKTARGARATWMGAAVVVLAGAAGCGVGAGAASGETRQARIQGAEAKRPVILMSSGLGGPQPNCSSRFGPDQLWTWAGSALADRVYLQERFDAEPPTGLPTVPRREGLGLTCEIQSQIFERYVAQMQAVWELEQHAKTAVAEALQSVNGGIVPFVFSGAHSTAAGSIAGAWKWAATHRPQNPAPKLGVIWVDAHADINTPDTSPSGNPHGMPLAKSAGLPMLAWEALQAKVTDCTPTEKSVLKGLYSQVFANWSTYHTGLLDGQSLALGDLAYIGVRDMDPAERALLAVERPNTGEPLILNVGVEEVRGSTNGEEETWLERMRAQMADVDYIVLDVDIDVLDPSISAGTGTPVDGGLLLDELHSSLQMLITEFATRLVLVEFTEVDPELDRAQQQPLSGKTFEHATEVIRKVAEGLQDKQR